MIKDMLKKVRIKRDVTQETVAQYLSIKRQTYSAYERGVSTPDAVTLKKLADYYNVPIEFFYLNENESDKLLESYVKNKSGNATDDLRYTNNEYNIYKLLLENINYLSYDSLIELEKFSNLLKLKDMQEKNTEITGDIQIGQYKK